MDFLEIARQRQSCRSYDETRPVEAEKLEAVLTAAQLSPSACNGQPYHFTVCTGEAAKEAAKATVGMGGMNRFAQQAPVLIVISEKPYVRSAAVGAKALGTDYRSIDMGIAAAYLTAEATAQGLGSCILGWMNQEKLKAICGISEMPRLVITLGYAKDTEVLRKKKRIPMEELVSYCD